MPWARFIHSYDVVQAFEAFRRNPRPGEVYNLGGGRQNSVSILEAITRIELILGYKIKCEYIDQSRVGDHICYISDLRKLRSHFASWDVTRSLDNIFEEMIRREQKRPLF